MFSLFSRLSVLFTLILLILGTLVWSIAHLSQQRYFKETSQQLNRPVAMYIADQVPLFINGNYDKRALAALAAHVKIINPSLDLYLLDPNGRVMASATENDVNDVTGNIVDLEPIKAFLFSDDSSLVYGDDPGSPGQRRIFSVYPLTDSGIGSTGCSPCGYVYAVLGEEQIVSPWQALMSSQTLQYSTWLLSAVLICALLAGLAIFFLLTKPLRAMTKSIAGWQLVASGVHSANPGGTLDTSIHHGNELELLEHTCHAMAQRLSRQYEELDDADKRRRQFLTSLSHDLRTPLTSISGALETVINKTDSLCSVDRGRFLAIAYRQTERLHRLIEQVFELARLDSGEVSLVIEPVSVQELAMDTLQDFEPNASEKGVNLKFEPADPEGKYLVNADLGQLNRVLVNLISNAIKHTPHGGTVSLSTSRRSENLMEVAVEDSGCGFARNLEGFPLSQTDSSMYATDFKSGTGLGLGIVSRILALHGTEARVSSRPGKGTQVRFQLQVSAQTSYTTPA